jgi:succinate dehydrogenase / fumarate reductase flavoprotein subunit
MAPRCITRTPFHRVRRRRRRTGSDPDLDESLRVNLASSGPGRVSREAIPPIPDHLAALMGEVSTVGKVLE